jgi:hypothetical protein
MESKLGISLLLSLGISIVEATFWTRETATKVLMEAADEAFRQLWGELEKEDLAKSKKQAKVLLQRKTRLRQKAKDHRPSPRPKNPTQDIYKKCFQRDASLQHFGVHKKILPGSKKSRSRSRLFVLPQEIWNVVLAFLNERDKVVLALTCRAIYKKVWQLWLHDARHLCHSEIERNWNRMAELCFDFTKHNGFHQETDRVFCSIFPWQRHNLKVCFQRNNMDVDILSWYDGSRFFGYRYL